MMVYEHLTSDDGLRVLWGCVTRGVGLVYLACFVSMYMQAIPFVGSRGIAPITAQLDRMRRDLPWYRCLQLNPSLLWLARSDTAIRAFVLSGMAASVAVMIGGPATPYALLVCWAVQLSFQLPLRLHYPWDASILELGFLAMFLPPLSLLPEVSATAVPHPLLRFAFHFLLFRIVFGFGKEKFARFNLRMTLYTRFFLISLPSTSPIGWWASKLPNFMHRSMIGFVAFAELLCPLLVLVPGPTRLVGAAGIIGQMLAIQITSSFGFFNMLTIVLCVAAFDHSSSLSAALARPDLLSPEHLPFTLAFPILFFGSFIYIPFDSWISAGYLYWPAFRRVPWRPLRALLALLRFIAPARVLSSYGVFGAHPAPPLRWLPVIEGSLDGQEWRTYRFRFQMTTEDDAPQFVAPHHPRLEGLSFYEVFGVEACGYLSSVNFNNPYWFTPSSMMLDRMAQRLLERDSAVLPLLKNNPFPDEPPRQIRVALYRVSSTTIEEKMRTGNWWRRQHVGYHIPATGRDDTVWNEWLPTPELFHFDATVFRRAARRCTGVSSEEYERFWETFLPFVRDAAAAATAAGDRGGDLHQWKNLPDVALAVRRRFSRDEVRGFQLTLARLTVHLLVRWEAVFERPASNFLRDVVGVGSSSDPAPDPRSLPDGADPEAVLQALAAFPRGPLRSPFQLGLAVHRLMLIEGREAWERMTAGSFVPGAPIPTRFALSRRGRRSMAAAAEEVGLDIAVLRRIAQDLTLENGLFLEGAVNYGVVARHANRFHVLFSFPKVVDPPNLGIIPPVFSLARELANHPELRLISGWGEETRLAPQLRLPRMVFGEDGIWREEGEALVSDDARVPSS
ncbi:lipase maturation factor family protein [Sorangium sp. So ce269]